MKPQFSYIKTFYLCFFSRELYRDIAKNWQGIGILYLFSALFLLFLIPALISSHRFGNMVEDYPNADPYKELRLFGTAIKIAPVLDFVDKFPNITFQNGKAYADIEQPYEITLSPAEGAKEVPFMIIDTTGKTTNLKDSKALILLKADGLVTKDPKGIKDKQMDFGDLQNAVIDKYSLLKIISWQPIIYFPWLIFSHLLLYSINALVFGLFGYGLCRFFGLDLYYKDNIRFAMVTTTPIILLEMLSALLSAQIFTKPSIIYLLTHAAYMYHAVDSNRKTKH